MNFSPLDIADASIQMGDLETALDMLDQHLSSTPADDEALRLRAGVLARIPGAENLQRALADLQGLSAPTLDDQVQRAALFERSSDLVSALNVVQDARRTLPESPQLVERALRLLSGLGQLTEARALAASMPPHWTWSQWSADLAAQAGDDSAAIEHYTRALTQMPPHADTHIYLAGARARMLAALAQAEERSSQFENAARHYAAARTVLASDATLTFREALVHARLGDLSRASALVHSALANAPDSLRGALQAELDLALLAALRQHMADQHP